MKKRHAEITPPNGNRYETIEVPRRADLVDQIVIQKNAKPRAENPSHSNAIHVMGKCGIVMGRSNRKPRDHITAVEETNGPAPRMIPDASVVDLARVHRTTA